MRGIEHGVVTYRACLSSQSEKTPSTRSPSAEALDLLVVMYCTQRKKIEVQ
jgi:hypothetical protein